MFKGFFKKTVAFFLTLLARVVLWRFRPKIVGITGTVGKTTAKEAIAAGLATKYTVRKSEKSYNSEFGVPLTILGASTAWGSASGWLHVIFQGLRAALAGRPYPEFLVLEMGIDRPGDLRSLTRWVPPQYAVFTTVGEVPVHIEYFESAEHVAEEKSMLLTVLPPDGLAVLNADDPQVLAAGQKTAARVLTYGLSCGAGERRPDVLASDIILTEEGTLFEVTYKEKTTSFRLPGMLGRQAVTGALPAIALGLDLGISPTQLAEGLTTIERPPGRLNLLEGVGGSKILDSTYNSSPLAASAALAVLCELPAKRRFAVLGDMLELGRYTAAAHRDLGRLAKKANLDYLLTVGVRARFIAEEAKRLRFGAKRIFSFDEGREVLEPLRALLEPGDLVLVKGSQGVRLERLVAGLLARPEDAPRLLCRQEGEWRKL